MAVYLGEYQVGLGGLTDLSGASVVNNQNKTVNPSTSQQIVTFDSGYTGLGTVTVTAMPSLTLPTSTSGSATSGYSSKATIGRSTSDQYINIGTGYNAAGAYYKISAVPNGTAGTPTATKGTVSNYSITVTPSVTNTAGYISSETKTGTAVTVTASELVSGTLLVTSNGTKDVTNYASISVNVPTGSTINNQDKTVTPSTSEQSITADSGYTGLGTVTVNAIPTGTAGTPSASKGTVSNHSISVTPSVTNTTGYITGGTKTGTAVTVSASELVSGSETKTSNGTYDVTNLAELVVNVSSSSPTIQSLSITPSTSEQTFNSSSVDGYKPVTVAAMPAITLPTAVSTTSSGTSKATLTLTGGTRYLNIPTGYNSTAQYYTLSVANGSASAPTSISGTTATVSTGTNTLTLTKTVSVTPVVSAGYVSSGTATNSSVSLTASVTTKTAATITPGTTNQTIASGTYLTGTQTIVGDADLVGGNILSTANIFGVQGTVVVQNYYTGSSAPSSSTGSNGDLYLQS